MNSDLPQLDELLRLDEDDRLALIRGAGDTIQAMHALIAQARARTLENPDLGVSSTLALVKLSDRLANDGIGAEARSAACHALSYANQTHRAIEMGQDAIRLAERSGEAPALANACLTSVQAHNLLGRREEALALCTRASNIFQNLSDSDRAGTAEMLAGVVLRAMDRPEKAIEHFKSAQRLLVQNEGLLAQLASNRAEALLDLGRFAEAQHSFESARAGFDRIGQAFGVAIVEGNLADLANRQGRLREAIALFERSRRHFETDDDQVEAARLDAEAAEVLMALGDYGEAESRLSRAMAVLDPGGLRSEHARALAAMGVTLGRRGKYEQALDALQQAKSSYEAIGQPLAANGTVGLAGRVLLMAGHAEKAADRLRAAIAGSIDQPVMQARLKIDLATALLKLDECCEAEQLLAEAAQGADQTGLTDLDLEIETVRVRLFGALGRPDEAMASLRRAIVLFESLRGSLSGDRLRASLVSGRATLFEEGIWLATAIQPDPGLVFEMAERMTARSLLDADDSAPPHNTTESGLGDSVLRHRLAEQRSELSALLVSIEQAHRSGRPASLIASYRKRVRSAEREALHLESRLGVLGAAGGFVSDPIDPERLADDLPDRVGVLMLIRSHNSLFGSLVTNNQFVIKQLAIQESDAYEAYQSLHTEMSRALARRAAGTKISNRLTDQVNQRLSEFGDALLGNFAAEIDSLDTLALIPSPGLQRLPIAALRINGCPLCSICTPVLAPSATVAHAIAMRQQTQDRAGLLAVGVADEAIPNVHEEIRQIRTVFNDAILLSDAHATAEAVEREADRASLLHFACHAEFSHDDPMASRLRLGDGWYSARQLAGLRLDGAAVVLGGCETGRSDERFAGEHFGLVRPLLIAGARRVLASQWKLDDVSSVRIFRDLYVRLAASTCHPAESIAQELAAVQTDAAQLGEHPALWGGLVAVGSW